MGGPRSRETHLSIDRYHPSIHVLKLYSTYVENVSRLDLECKVVWFRVLTPISTPGTANSRERESIVETNICSCHPIFSQSQQTRPLGSVSVRADPFRRDSRTNLSRELDYLPSTSSLLSFVFVSSSFFLPNLFSSPLPPRLNHITRRIANRIINSGADFSLSCSCLVQESSYLSNKNCYQDEETFPSPITNPFLRRFIFVITIVKTLLLRAFFAAGKRLVSACLMLMRDARGMYELPLSALSASQGRNRNENFRKMTAVLHHVFPRFSCGSKKIGARLCRILL